MSDLTFEQLTALFPQVDPDDDRLEPRVHKLLPASIVGAIILLMPATVVGSWEAGQARLVGPSIPHTMTQYEGIMDAAKAECVPRYGAGAVDVRLSAWLSRVLRNGSELQPGEYPQPGDTAEIQCGSYAVQQLNERVPLADLVPYILSRPPEE